jgi:AcrR family transcriptional regulator
VTSATPPRRRGRPPRTKSADTPAARDRILAAAREEFSERGYDKTSMRGIAKAAGVDSALVHHYFGTKDGLFNAAMELPFDPATIVPALLEPGLDGLGERLVRFYLHAWDAPASRARLQGILRSAMAQDAAAALLREFVTRQVLGRVASAVDAPDAELRATFAGSQLVGLGVLRYVLRVEPLASAAPDTVVAVVAPTIQRYLTGELVPR